MAIYNWLIVIFKGQIQQLEWKQFEYWRDRFLLLRMQIFSNSWGLKAFQKNRPSIYSIQISIPWLYIYFVCWQMEKKWEKKKINMDSSCSVIGEKSSALEWSWKGRIWMRERMSIVEHQWFKKSVLLSFNTHRKAIYNNGELIEYWTKNCDK